MKRIALLACALACSLSANAACVGGYIGLGAGDGILKTSNNYIFSSTGGAANGSKSRGGLSGRVFAGANFLPYLGLEAGYARYARSKYTGNFAGSSSILAYYARTYDVVFKGYLPLGRSGFNAYAVAGAARVAETIRYPNANVPLNGTIAQPATLGNSHIYKTRPIYGFGGSYDFNPCFSANVEATQIRRLGNFNSNAASVPFMNLVTVNVAYHIT